MVSLGRTNRSHPQLWALAVKCNTGLPQSYAHGYAHATPPETR